MHLEALHPSTFTPWVEPASTLAGLPVLPNRSPLVGKDRYSAISCNARNRFSLARPFTEASHAPESATLRCDRTPAKLTGVDAAQLFRDRLHPAT